MAWKNLDLAKWADEVGVDINEIDQKLKLREMIIKVRNGKGLSQGALGDLVGVSRSRIAQIEAGTKLHRTSFDVFLRILQGLGYRYRITTTKLAA
jgi:transcriptional regulator with XRE-family HTH domain